MYQIALTSARPLLPPASNWRHADPIATPTLFMGGDKDFNIPLVAGEQMYEALKDVGVPAELIVYPGEFHGFNRPSCIRDRYVRWFDGYDQHVLGKPMANPAKPASAATK